MRHLHRMSSRRSHNAAHQTCRLSHCVRSHAQNPPSIPMLRASTIQEERRRNKDSAAEGCFSLAARTLNEAQAWTRYLVNRGRSVSIGLLQVNSEHAARLGLTWVQLFDPCTNMRVGAHLLTADYRQAAAVLGDGEQALQFALSGYNSGLPLVGFSNGYVDTVIQDEFTLKLPNDLR